MGGVPQSGLGVRAKGSGPQGRRQRRLHGLELQRRPQRSPTPRRSLRSSRRKSRSQPRQPLRPLQTRPTPLPRGRVRAVMQKRRSAFTSVTTVTVPRDSCPYSHDKELRKRALAARRDAGHQQTLATTKGGGKAGGKGGGKNAQGQG